MPLETQVVEIPFAGGMDEKTRSELLPRGKFTALSNLIQAKNGALVKAPGNSIGALAGIGGVFLRKVFGFRDEICAVASNANTYPYTSANIPNSLNAYSPTLGKWTQMGGLPDAVVSGRVAIGTGTVLDQAYCNGFFAVAWLASDGVTAYISVFDAATFEAPYPSTKIAGLVAIAGNVRLGYVGTKFVLVYYNSTNLSGRTLDTANPGSGWSGASTLPTAANVTSGSIDVLGGSNRFYVAYVDSVATAAKVFAYDSTLASQGSQTGPTSATSVGIGGSDADTIWLVSTVAQAIKVTGLNSSLAITGTTATVITAAGTEVLTSLGAATTGANQAVITAGNDTGGVQSFYWRPVSISAGAIVAGGAGAYGQTKHFRMVPVSKPFVAQNKAYAMVSYQTGTTVSSQQYLYCVDLSFPLAVTGATAARAVACISPRLACPPGNSVFINAPPGAPVVGNVAYVLNTLVKSNVVRGIELVALDFYHYWAYSAANYLDIITLGCGVPSFYDGSNVAEQGFLVAPEITGIVGSGDASDFPQNGVWDYVVIWEHVDGRGQIHRSAPSAVTSFTATSQSYTFLTVTIPSLVLTQRATSTTSPTPVNAVVYRTASGGSTYYRVGSIANDPTASTMSFADTMTDTVLTTKSLLYKQPGTGGTALDRVNPPSFLWTIAHNDLMWGIEGNNVWYTGQPVVGEGPWWSDAFQFPVNGGAGPLTGMASMDGRLVLFKRNRIFIVDGRGAADNGSGNDLSNPSELPVDVGCINPRSIIVTSDGVWFQSLRGLELLNRSLQLENFAGQEVESTAGGSNVIASAVLDEARGLVTFIARPSDSAHGGKFVFWDLVHKMWSTQSLAQTNGLRSGALVGSTLGTTPVYTFCTDVSGAAQFSTSSWLDATVSSAYAPSSFTTGAIALAGIAGFQRVREIMLYLTRYTAFDLTVAIDYDDAGTFAETHTFTQATLSGLSSPDTMLRIRPNRQKCHSIAVKVTDATPSSGVVGTGQGAAYLAMRLRIGVKQGSAKVAVGAAA